MTPNLSLPTSFLGRADGDVLAAFAKIDKAFGSIPTTPTTLIALPAAAGWNEARFPVSVSRDGRGSYSTDWAPRKDVAQIKAIFDGEGAGTTGVYYANAAAANDGGNGLTAATAKRVARSAVKLGEDDASKSAIIVYCLEGDYDRTLDFLLTATGGGVAPSKPLALIAVGNVKMGPFTPPGAVTWAADTSVDASGKTYKATRASTARVTNKLNLDPRYGKEVPHSLFASAAAAGASSGVDALAIVGNDIWVKRADGAPVTDANTRVILNAAACAPGAQPFYTQGIDWYGGVSGCFQRNIATINPAVAEDSWFLMPGIEGSYTASTIANCVTVDGDNLVALVRCGFGYPIADFINGHGFQGRNHLLVIDPAGFIGFGQAVSSQVLTGHGADNSGGELSTRMLAINVDGSGGHSAGAARRFVGRSTLIEFGGISDADRGDVAAGGNVPSTGVQADEAAQIWLYEHDVKRCVNAYTVATNARIFLQGGSPGGGLKAGNGPLIPIT